VHKQRASPQQEETETVLHDAVQSLAIRTIEALPDPFGILNVDIMVDGANDEPYVLEVNARIAGGYPLSHVAGAPGIGWLLDSAAGRHPDYAAAPLLRRVSMSRYDLAHYTKGSESN
jgi:predicted ATP-grasp superfamily ATP-dependent carboligase